MDVTVTGGLGFLGRYVVSELLERRHTVTVVDDLSTCDLRTEPDWAGHDRVVVDECSVGHGLHRRDCDAVVHLARRHPVERELEVFFQSFEGYVSNFMGFVRDRLKFGSLRRIVVASGLDAVVGASTVRNPMTTLSRSLREVVGYWHRPPQVSVQMVYLPELVGPGRLGPSALFSVHQAEGEADHVPVYRDVAHVEAAAGVLVDRLEARPCRALDWVVGGESIDGGGGCYASPDQRLRLDDERLRRYYEEGI